jgi:NAD(P)-dependent dehydrogenase (short-subunit alcohol dehydrogenase family)
MRGYVPAEGELMTVWFITGASRGFGIEITRQALGRGDQVAATARHPEEITEAIPDTGNALLTLPLDVTRAGQAAAAVSAVVARFGRIDSLVNNAGRGLLGAVEEVSDAEARAVFDVNVFGLLTVTRAVLPVMREQGAGQIINISSSGGFIGRPGWGVYCSTKFAVEGLSESMGHELAPLGIQVTAIEPGAFRTNFLDDSSLAMAEATIEDYTGTAGATRQWAKETNHAQAGDPVKAAKVIADLAGRGSLPERIQLGEDCFTAVAQKLARTARDQARWREISISTGYHA